MRSLKRATVVALVLAGAIAPATSAARIRTAPRPGCAQLFTVHMGMRAARAVYAGTARTTLHQLRLLGYIEHCQRNPRARPFMRWFDHHLARLHAARRYAKLHPAPALDVWAIPAAIVRCESTFQNLPPNSAGASGYYQIIPSTWISYGGGRYASQAYLASKSAQDTIAGRIWDGGRGSSQWVCAHLVRW